MGSRLLLGIGVGLVIGGMLLGGSVSPRDDRWIVKRATELGMVPATTRAAVAAKLEPAAQPMPPTVIARTPVPVATPSPAPQPKPQAEVPKPASTPAPQTKPAPKPKSNPQPAPEPVHQDPPRRITISENATLKEVLGVLQDAGVVQNADDRGQIMLELRSGRHFVPGSYSIPPGQGFEDTVKKITASSR